MGKSAEIDAALLPRPTVLVAEDDDDVRELTVQFLADAGLEVLCARDGEEAVAKVRAEAERIHALVLDLMMPVMDGKTALEEILRLRPDLPVIVTSGVDGHQTLGPNLASRVLTIYRKPYRMSEFVETVRSAVVAGSRARATHMRAEGDRS